MQQTSRLIGTQLVLTLFFGLPVSQGQAIQVPFQRIRFVDKVVEGYLRIFWTRTDARFVSVLIRVDPKDKGYIYQVDPINHVEEVESFRSSEWGHWRGKTILFYGWGDVETICRITDTTALSNLKQYAVGLLPRAMVRRRGSNDVRLGAFYEGPWLTFKMLKGREVYYRDSYGYDSQEVPDQLPPVPEASRKN